MEELGLLRQMKHQSFAMTARCYNMVGELDDFGLNHLHPHRPQRWKTCRGTCTIQLKARAI
jgi:hypothetical protein